MEDKEKSTPAPKEQQPREDAVRTVAGKLFEAVEAFVLALSVVLVLLTFVVRHSPVEGSSMYPTLQDGDVLLVSGFAYTPKQGDIIIAQSRGFGLARPLVKRVIATGGDVLDIDFDTWEVRVNGVLLEESYINRTDGSMSAYSVAHLSFPLTVPEGYLFVMGDNRRESADSRFSGIGLIDERYVVGHVWSRVLPTDKATLFS